MDDTKLEYLNLVLKLSPKSITGIAAECTAYANLAYQLHMKEKRGKKLNVNERKLLKNYLSDSQRLFLKARSLRWRPQTKEERERYLEIVKAEKEKLSHQQNVREQEK